MDWETTRAQYLNKLEKAETVLRGCGVLCGRVPSDLPGPVKPKIAELGTQIDRQLRKLRNNQFHVAVIGLEKSGKSVLLNAWLGEDILPSMDKRCTYTSTEVWSAPNQESQILEIEYYNQADFHADLTEKRRTLDSLIKGRDRDDLEAEVTEIGDLQHKIEGHLRKGTERRAFLDIKEIRDELNNAVALDRSRARAIKRIVIRTVSLCEARDIVFHDVPGFNSPVELHKTQALRKLAECDAIIYAKNVRTPSLEGSERTMLGVADAEDPAVRVAGKAFVALTQIDLTGDAQHLRDLRLQAQEEWRDVPQERLIPVCPPALLYRLGTGGSEIMRMGPKIAGDLERLGAEDGIQSLKKAVNAYIETDRAGVVARRCDTLIRELAQVSRTLLETLEPKFPEAVADLDFAKEDHLDAEFNRWWTGKWREIREEFNRFYLTTMMPKQDVDRPAAQHAELESFKEKFDQLVDAKVVAPLTGSDKGRLEALYTDFGLTDDGTILPQKAHAGIRSNLAKHAMTEIEELADELAFALERIIQELADYIVNNLFWGLEPVRERLLLGNSHLHERIEHGMSTLFLRFARPAVNLFLGTPRGTRDRELLFSEYKRDVSILSDYYEGPSPARKFLESYLLSGLWQAKQQIARALDPIDIARGATGAKPAGNLDSIITEIGQDVEALADYLKCSVFSAAGFKAYCNQEIDRVRRRFIEHEEVERGWYVLVRSYYRRGHPGVKQAAPNMEVDYEFRRGVVNAINDLRAALQEM